jgi:hypothetical protein
MITILGFFALIFILKDPTKQTKLYAQVIIWITDTSQGAEHWILAFRYFTSAVDFGYFLEHGKTNTQKYRSLVFLTPLVTYSALLGIACAFDRKRA